MKQLIDRRQKLAQDIEHLQQRLEEVDGMIELMGDDHSRERKEVTPVLIELLKEAGDAGLTAREAVNRALAKGFELNSSSIAVILSRMKREGDLVRSNGRYILVA